MIEMNYVTAVADLFLTLNPGILILGPADYLIIAEWEKQEIPLEVVLASIEEACPGPGHENARIDDLNYFRGIVKKNFEIWLQKTRSGLIDHETDARRSLQL